jgi:hypothetical protein
MPGQNNSEVIEQLRKSFGDAHHRYIHADIDRTFKKKTLSPLREALIQFEKTESNQYAGGVKDCSERLLLRLQSMNLLIEGLYWIGCYAEAASELKRFGDVDYLFKAVIGKSQNGILIDIARLDGLKNAAALLRKLAGMNGLVEQKSRIIEELIRIAVNTAVVCHYIPHHYESASSLLEDCRTLALATTPERGRAPYALMAQIDYFAACVARQENRLSDCDRKLRKVLDHYLQRTDLKLKKYLASNKAKDSRAEFERSADLSLYRTALVLMARSDLNRRLGNLRIGYENLSVARIILAEKDTIHRAYARMLFAIISREMHATEKDILAALEMIRESQKDFKDMGHQKYFLRSLFETAYTEYYLARLYTRTDAAGSNGKAEKRIAEALEMLARLRVGADPRWKAQYLTLEGRLLILRDDANAIEKGRAKIAEAIKILGKSGGHKTYLVEALIAMSRVLMEKYVRQAQQSYPKEMLNDAEKLLLEAQRKNQDSQGRPENNKIEAIIDFALARIKIRQGHRSNAEEHLRAGAARLPVIDSDGVKRLYEFAQRDVSDSPLIFEVSNDLDMDKNIEALRRFIIERATDEQKIRGKKPWKIINKSRAQFYNLKKPSGE